MAEIATKAGRAFTAADSPNMFLNMDAAMVISESINSSFGTTENWGHMLGKVETVVYSNSRMQCLQEYRAQ